MLMTLNLLPKWKVEWKATSIWKNYHCSRDSTIKWILRLESNQFCSFPFLWLKKKEMAARLTSPTLKKNEKEEMLISKIKQSMQTVFVSVSYCYWWLQATGWLCFEEAFGRKMDFIWPGEKLSVNTTMRAHVWTHTHTLAQTHAIALTHARTHSDNVRKKIILRKYGKKVFNISIKISSEKLVYLNLWNSTFGSNLELNYAHAWFGYSCEGLCRTNHTFQEEVIIEKVAHNVP